ncbi:hypothetical protein V8F20_001016 [Naviculisporaceae sp. PSN 640]
MPRLQALSPWTYGPRRRRSPRLVIIWTLTFLFILYITWRYTSNQRKAAAAAQEIADQMLKGRGEADADAGAFGGQHD